ncbi:arsenate reductase (glutaredoxin) [Pseudoalteromonas sp. SCSIO 43095]|jgi:arsenate reductase|uniref:arsenate reductase (glutaredoxin) n=1 Tax=Pseudoalteromonas TaxID=53246 RepID=UPI000451428F|nr:MULTISPECIES: arsenate reductase (glutaredoxin) [Pseudoalteromonas]EWS97399.1 arsenate reductase [Pseudoalteromonas sp. SCSIO_11900]MBT2152700.1 arsenate reductase (glutaredoxin) [Pseudoalteromonas tetraodonis]MCK8137178.1 arsenate reductase (glutaredoxin) [Pseudoalteromonas sp. 2CM28B]MDX1360353.1 arsenate reductase (glutaredoxin) [Pseudoalteromonas tetraodonis]TMO24164.1 arsenate reductase (glutaredoxin) [Pseudoalteromonas sp. S4741]
MSVTIYHNPRCSKSRETLNLLQSKNIEPSVVEYLKTPLSHEQISTLVSQLGFNSARDLMRTKEEQYKALNLKDENSESELIDAMVNHPKLIERPIVVNNNKAALGRPPENVLSVL